jgi:hypothetical protein
LDRLSLPIVGALVNDEPKFGTHVRIPDVALEVADPDHIEAAQVDVSVVALPEPPDDDPLAVTLGRRPPKRARTRNRALAEVDEVALETPFLGHRYLSRSTVDPFSIRN